MTDTNPAAPATYVDLQDLIGKELGPTEWHHVTQQRVDAFADATGDHQWIHVDPARAADTDLGGTIAHGLYSLSLTPALSAQLLRFDGFAHSLNYGYGKVRFPAPVPVGSRIRLRSTLVSAEKLPGGIQLTMSQVMECEGSEKPVMVAESLARVVERS